MTKKSNKPIILIVAAVLLLGGGYLLFSKKQTDSKPSLTNENMPTPTSEPTQVDQPTGATLYYDNLPFYPGITELDRQLTEGDGVMASYQTLQGVTGKEVLDYYEDGLTKQGWKITFRDVDDARLEALSIDEVQLRVWIYYDGSDGSGTTYNIDFRIPGSEPWAPLPNQ